MPHESKDKVVDAAAHLNRASGVVRAGANDNDSPASSRNIEAQGSKKAPRGNSEHILHRSRSGTAHNQTENNAELGWRMNRPRSRNFGKDTSGLQF